MKTYTKDTLTREAILTNDLIESTIEDIAWPNDEVMQFAKELSRAIEQAILHKYRDLLAERDAFREALDQCRFALEPYDDVKPRDWVTDRERLRWAHKVAKAALAQEQGGSDDA